MVHALRRAGAWVGYRLIRAVWWVRRPVVLGVRILIADDDRVLLVRHSYRDEWFLPGGSPEAGEPLPMTARREAKEETGIDVAPPELLGIYSTLAQPASDHVVVFVSQATTLPPPEAIHRQSSAEIDAVRWAPVKRFPADTAAQTRQAIEDWRRGGNWYVSGRGLIS
jgi:8-oxo-dGTP pyrophosphatase MutT (NUDIX family)